MSDDSMRSLSSFGVAGLISDSGEVFYTNDLRARNVGRISDLISAQIRGSGADELKVRALLTYGAFHCYTLAGIPNQHDEAVSPATIEVGVDAAYVAVAISFHYERNRIPKWNGLDERITSGGSDDPFERVLEWMTRHATQVIVRYETKERRVEVVSLLSRHDSELRDPLTVVMVDSVKAPLLEVSLYRELGDLEYAKLLRNPVATVSEPEADPASEEIRVAGNEQSPDESARVVSGSSEAAAEEVVRLKALGLGQETSAELLDLVKDYEKTIAQLRGSLAEIGSKLVNTENAASDRKFSSQSDEKPAKEDWGLDFLKQVWPFASKEEEESNDEPQVILGAELAPESVVVLAATQQTEEAPSPLSSAEVEANRALVELSEIAKSNRSSAVESTMQEIRDTIDEEKAKRWIDSLSLELLQERAKLGELQKTLTKQFRQRDAELKNSSRAIEQEMKKTAELLRQKEAVLENKNDQIVQLNLAVQRAGTASNDKDQQQMKVKLDRAQRLAQMKEEESKVLLNKTRDLENRLIIAQAKAQKGTDPMAAQKTLALEKKVEEYKRINQRLMESMNQNKEKSTDKDVADLRRKLELLDRQNNESKKALDKSNFRMRELQDAERKFQADLARTLEENRQLRKSQGRGSGESGSSAA